MRGHDNDQLPAYNRACVVFDIRFGSLLLLLLS